MINPRWHNHQIALLQPQPNPRIVLAPHIEVASASQNIPDLLVFMQVLVEEGLNLLFIAGEKLGGDFDLVAVLVVALRSDLIDGIQVVRQVVVGYTEGGEICWVDRAAGVVREALVTLLVWLVGVRLVGMEERKLGYLEVVEPVCFHIDGLVDFVMRCWWWWLY